MNQYFSRHIDQRITTLAKGFPIISVTGPRQSGKTTYLRHRFHEYDYFNLELPRDFDRLTFDPEHFFAEHPCNIIIDEIQKAPQLFSFLQVLVDERQEMGSIIISGSQNFLITETITQSLAGRVVHMPLYPFSQNELRDHALLKQDFLSQILKGCYPALYTRELSPTEFYNAYLATYVERDVRQLKQINDLTRFRAFIGLLAGRVGQLVDYTSLANDTGVAVNTIRDWIRVLEASYIVFRLPPYFRNHNKRLIRSPKVYFYDTGLLSALLNIDSREELDLHYARGGIFENYVIAELKKMTNDVSPSSDLYFYRDSNGNEVDLIIDAGLKQVPVEIKSSSSFTRDFLKGLGQWRSFSDSGQHGYVVYSGDQPLSFGDDRVIPWNTLEVLVQELS